MLPRFSLRPSHDQFLFAEFESGPTPGERHAPAHALSATLLPAPDTLSSMDCPAKLCRACRPHRLHLSPVELPAIPRSELTENFQATRHLPPAHQALPTVPLVLAIPAIRRGAVFVLDFPVADCRSTCAIVSCIRPQVYCVHGQCISFLPPVGPLVLIRPSCILPLARE